VRRAHDRLSPRRFTLDAREDERDERTRVDSERSRPTGASTSLERASRVLTRAIRPGGSTRTSQKKEKQI